MQGILRIRNTNKAGRERMGTEGLRRTRRHKQEWLLQRWDETAFGQKHAAGKKGHFMVIQRSAHEESIRIINVSVLNRA